VLSILFGIMLVSRPVAGMAVMAVLLGAYMTAIGVLQIALSLRLRKVGQRLSGSTPAA
jgi:uncharacterized membrane protein HdeD (DUF308 family)